MLNQDITRRLGHQLKRLLYRLDDVLYLYKQGKPISYEAGNQRGPAYITIKESV